MGARRWNVTRQEGAGDLGFALACLHARAITGAEWRDWVWHVIDTAGDGLPAWFFELDDPDLARRTRSVLDLAGFWPGGDLDGRGLEALDAIAVLRGTREAPPQPLEGVVQLRPDGSVVEGATFRIVTDEPVPDRRAALARLAARPDIAARFHEIFPFLPHGFVPAGGTTELHP